MKVLRLVAGAAVAITMIAAPIAAHASFFPADRQTYTCEAAKPDGTVPCQGADHVTFDSFTNNPVVGDERAFFAGSIDGGNVEDSVAVKDGDIVSLRMYVHNNADPNLIGDAAAVAHDVNVKVLIPTASQTTQNLVGFIGASNATPASINDTMSITGASNFTLSYVAGSAVFQHSPTGVAGAQQFDTVSDNIVTSGGADLGDLKGCFQYSGYVTLKVKVNMPSTPTPPVTPTYTCDAFDITADNKNRTVTISNFKQSTSNGAAFTDAVINWGDNSSALTTNNVVGQTHSYKADGTYTISATAHFTVNGQDVTAGGANCAKTVTFSTTTPPVVTPPTTTPPATTTTPTSLVNTGPGQVVGLFAAASVAGSVAYRLYLSRRLTQN